MKTDFRGGYSTDLSPEKMASNMVLEGQNLYYKSKLVGRPGWTNHSSDATLHAATSRGFCRAYINSNWYNIIAVDDGSDVQFYYGDAGSYTKIQNGASEYTFTKSINVEMAVFGEYVVAVNGTDKPAIIYYDSAWIAKDLEAYDERTRGTDEWFAGLYDASEGSPYIDDTTDAQSDTESDFAISNGVSGDGFYVAGVTVFNKIVFHGCEDIGTDVTASIKYYAGSDTWADVTTVSEPDWDGTEADKTLEFNVPLDTDGELAWEKYGDVDTQTDAVDTDGDSVPGGLLNRYVLRVTFTTTDTLSAGDCDYLSVSHSQYLTQLFLNDKPNAVCVHKNRLFLAAGNAFRFGPPNQLTGWDSRDIEYCQEGGEKIVAMASANNYLAVFKSGGVYQYLGTTTNNFTLRYTPCQGLISPRGAATVAGTPVYIARDGIRAFTGESSTILSRHIQADIDSWTLTNAVVIEWDGNILISFPSDSIMLWADPDTLRTDDMGNGVLSLWEWTGMAADQLAYANGFSDSGYLLAWDITNKRFVHDTAVGYDVAWDASQTAITQTLQTKYDSFKKPFHKKAFKRVKVETSKSGDWTFTAYGNNGASNATATIASGTGTGHYTDDISLPYTVDGYNLSYKLVNATTNSVEILGFETDYTGREF